MKCNNISTTYQNGIVATAGILNHCSYLGFGNRHQSDIFFANKGTCTIKGDISINKMSDGINVIDDGYRASCGDENLHALFFCLLNSLYSRCWNLVRLKGYQRTIYVEECSFYCHDESLLEYKGTKISCNQVNL